MQKATHRFTTLIHHLYLCVCIYVLESCYKRPKPLNWGHVPVPVAHWWGFIEAQPGRPRVGAGADSPTHSPTSPQPQGLEVSSLPLLLLSVLVPRSSQGLPGEPSSLPDPRIACRGAGGRNPCFQQVCPPFAPITSWVPMVPGLGPHLKNFLHPLTWLVHPGSS